VTKSELRKLKTNAKDTVSLRFAKRMRLSTSSMSDHNKNCVANPEPLSVSTYPSINTVQYNIGGSQERSSMSMQRTGVMIPQPGQRNESHIIASANRQLISPQGLPPVCFRMAGNFTTITPFDPTASLSFVYSPDVGFRSVPSTTSSMTPTDPALSHPTIPNTNIPFNFWLELI